MEFEYPEAIEKIKDIKAIYDMNEKISPIQDASNLELDLFTGTATENGIRRREKLYKINTKDTDTLEDRRYKVLIKENDKIPYTMKTLKERLNTLCGVNEYTVSLLAGKLVIRVELTRKKMYEDVQEMLEKMIPLNLALDCKIRYNQHGLIGRYTHSQISAYTHEQLRNEVIS